MLSCRCGGGFSQVLRLPGHHHHGAARRVSVLGLTEHAQHGGRVPPPQPGLTALQPAQSEVPRLDQPQFPPLPAGGALPGETTHTHTLADRQTDRQSADSPVFVWQVYFSSLPLGIYLLMIGQLWLGVVLVSLVPSTLLLCVLYGFCQCLCHEVLEAMAAHRHSLS